MHLSGTIFCCGACVSRGQFLISHFWMLNVHILALPNQLNIISHMKVSSKPFDISFTNGLLIIADAGGMCFIIVLLDVSAASDTIHHRIL